MESAIWSDLETDLPLLHKSGYSSGDLQEQDYRLSLPHYANLLAECHEAAGSVSVETARQINEALDGDVVAFAVSEIGEESIFEILESLLEGRSGVKIEKYGIEQFECEIPRYAVVALRNIMARTLGYDEL